LKKLLIIIITVSLGLSLFIYIKYKDAIFLKFFNENTRRLNIEKNNRLYEDVYKALEGHPPITPKWVFEPWVWEDNINTQESTWELVKGYLDRNIPVGGVIIDSPWQTGYNTFEFDSERYPDPGKLISDLKNVDVHTILWTTSAVVPNSPNYDFACDNGFFIRKVDGQDPCPVTYFWRSAYTASHIDFFNPDALAWWQSLMDKVLDIGIDGWKVDKSDYYISDLGDKIQTFSGVKSVKEYSNVFYKTFYEYTKKKRGPDLAMITARPFDYPYWYAPINVNTAGWVGDQTHTWAGLKHALNNIFISASAGFGAVGSDIGGYFGDQEINSEFKILFIRWAQMGAMMPIMENGGLNEHRPWMFDEETVDIYRYFAKLHHQLVPYLYHLSIEANKTGVSLVRPIEKGDKFDVTNWEDDWRYTLGGDILIAPMYDNSMQRSITFPEGSWIDYWNDDNIFKSGQTVVYSAPLSKYPIFWKAGAIIPLQVDDSETGHGSPVSKKKLTFILYPFGKSDFVFYQTSNDSIKLESIQQTAGLTINVSASSENFIFRVKVSDEIGEVKLHPFGNLIRKNTLSDFESAELCWYFDSDKNYAWIKFSTVGNAVSLELITG